MVVKRYVIALFLAVVSLSFMFGCASNTQMRELRSIDYRAFLDATTKPQPIFEMKAKAGQTLKIENIESLTIYAPPGNGGNGSRSIKPLAEPENPVVSVVSRTLDRATDVGLSMAPWYLAGKELSNVLETALKNAGHNTSDSYNTPYTNSFNGDYRDFTGNVDNANNSINNSYNPVDRHDIVDRHDVPVEEKPEE